MRYYLSFVLCGRNDNYGRDYLRRLQTLINNVDYLGRQNALSCQVVFVEWNPPADRPPIRSVINWGSHVGVKIVTVPGYIDARLPVNQGRSGLHEFIAKNVGVRRADGQFVLCCTSDLVFSPELFEYLARRELTTDAVYRTVRINVRALPEAVAASEAPELCRRGVVTADLVGADYDLDNGAFESLRRMNELCMLGAVPLIKRMFDFPGAFEPLRMEAPLLRQFPQMIHTNAAGDFTLISREGWENLGGYLENDCRNHVDSWFCFHAAKRGFAQVILPMRMCVYHQAHDSSPLAPYWETLSKMSKLPQNPKWGLADETLPMEVLQVGA